MTYTPNANFNGSDSFTFKANDGDQDSNMATVSITVNPVDDAPVADDQTVLTAARHAQAITLTATDGDGDALTYSIVTGPDQRRPERHAAQRDLHTQRRTTAAATALPSRPTTAIKTRTRPRCPSRSTDPPVADAQTVTTDEDTAQAITLTATDTESDPLTYSIVDGPTNGVLSGAAPNLTYTPNANYNGSDSFTFKANDGYQDSNIATVSITINPIEDAPVANDQTVTTDEDTPKDITLTATDADGDPLTFTIVTGPTNGVLSGTRQPNLYAQRRLSAAATAFTFKANDGDQDSNIATVSITVNAVNDPPVADDQP